MDEPTKKFKIRLVVLDNMVNPMFQLAENFSDFEFIDNNSDDMPCSNVPNEPGIYEAIIHFYWVDEEEWFFELHDIENISHPERYRECRPDEDGNMSYVVDKYDNIYVFSTYDGRWHPNPEKLERSYRILEEKVREYNHRLGDLFQHDIITGAEMEYVTGETEEQPWFTPDKPKAEDKENHTS